VCYFWEFVIVFKSDPGKKPGDRNKPANVPLKYLPASFECDSDTYDLKFAINHQDGNHWNTYCLKDLKLYNLDDLPQNEKK
jgi:hypothetical protein